MGDQNNPGLGMNIVRYNFGANPIGHNVTELLPGGVTRKIDNGGIDRNCPSGEQTFRTGASIGTFEPAQGVWNWKNDPNQVNVLKAARQRIPTQEAYFEGFANSAPDWMLLNHCSKGNSIAGLNVKALATDNLDPNHEQDYANYLVTIAMHFASQYGIFFNTIEPFNEPESSWWTTANDQEGMHVSVSQQQRVIKDLYAAMQNKDFVTGISAADDNSIDETVSDLNQYDETTLAYLGQINTHSYNGSNMVGLYSSSQQNGLPLWMSEYTTDGTSNIGSYPCTMPEDNSMSSSMKSAFWLSCRITNDLGTMHANAWVYWQAIDGGNYGLLHADMNQKDKNATCFTQTAIANRKWTTDYSADFIILWAFLYR